MIAERANAESEFLNCFSLDCAYATENGPRHTRNEDRYVFLAPGSVAAEKRRQGYLFGVFDGNGGAAGGAKAAQTCADAFRFLLKQADESGGERLAVFAAVTHEANRRVHEARRAEREFAKMACTATVAWLWEEEADDDAWIAGLLAHVGDSRAYLLRRGEIDLLTQDDKKRGVVTHAMGMAPGDFQFGLRKLKLQRDDLLLLATNGLWKPSALDLPPLAASVEHRPLEFVREWLAAARRNGSLDDQTAIAVLVE